MPAMNMLSGIDNRGHGPLLRNPNQRWIDRQTSNEE